MRVLIEYRFVLSLVGSVLAGVIGLHVWPFPTQNTVLALIQARQPAVYAGFVYTYATVWFSTPFLMLSGALSFVYIFVARWLLGTPRHELAVLRDRGLDQLIEDVIGAVADELRVQHQRVTIRFVEPVRVAHGLDAGGARLDEWHTVLLLFSCTTAVGSPGDQVGIARRAVARSALLTRVRGERP